MYNSSRLDPVEVVEANRAPEQDAQEVGGEEDSDSQPVIDTSCSVLFTGPITGVRLVSSGFIKRASVAVKSTKAQRTMGAVVAGTGESDDEASGWMLYLRL